MADENELKKNPKSFTDSASQSESNTKQETESRRFLDGELLSQILAGLAPNMTDDEISAFAENLLRPVLNAGLESAQQSYESTKLGKEQEIENLAATLSRSIAEQQNAYRQSAANVETAALSRGMGRSSYTMQTLANQGSALAKAVQQLFGDTGTNIIGTRHGEKLYETLMTREERLRSEDMGNYFRVAADNRDLNYDKFFVNGQVHTEAEEPYTSHNTNRLDVEGTVKKILATDYVQEQLRILEAGR